MLNYRYPGSIYVAVVPRTSVVAILVSVSVPLYPRLYTLLCFPFQQVMSPGAHNLTHFAQIPYLILINQPQITSNGNQPFLCGHYAIPGHQAY
jgi:hypothetical protein